MNDTEMLEKLYEDMVSAMISKDEEQLKRIHDDSFVLVHMTGMRQDKNSYIRSILNGTLNYYSAKTVKVETEIKGDRAVLSGRSLVEAAVFGGGKHTWRLRLVFDAIKTGGQWRFTKAQASTW